MNKWIFEFLCFFSWYWTVIPYIGLTLHLFMKAKELRNAIQSYEKLLHYSDASTLWWAGEVKLKSKEKQKNSLSHFIHYMLLWALRFAYLPRFLKFVLVVQLLSRVQLFVTRRTAARQASLSFIFSWSLLRLMSIESVMSSNLIPLSPPSPALNLSQHQHLYWWISSSDQVAKVLELQH